MPQGPTLNPYYITSLRPLTEYKSLPAINGYYANTYYNPIGTLAC